MGRYGRSGQWWVMLSALVAGCATDRPTVVLPPPPSPGQIEAARNEIAAEFVSATARGVAGYSLPGRPRVKVTRDGIPVPGATVFWSVTEGHVFPASSETDARGLAEVSDWRLGTRVGQQALVASLGQTESSRQVVITTDAFALTGQ